MTFIVTLIALLIERFFDWSHLRRWSWYFAFEHTLAEKLAGKSAYLTLICVIAPILIAVAFLAFIFTGMLYGFVTLVFQLFILLYCLGPQNLWADSFACMHPAADQQLKKLFGVTEMDDAQKLHRQLLNNIFIEANRRVFAVIFWYAILGPLGAVLYRLVTLSAQEEIKAGAALEVAKSARKIEVLLDWLPIRLFTFIFALGGHFAAVLNCWRKNLTLGLADNEVLLTECGRAALAEPQEKIAEDGSAEKNAIHLLDRVFIIVLVILAVCVLLIG